MNLRQIFRPQANKAAHLLITPDHLPCHHQKRQKTGTFLVSSIEQLKASTPSMESQQQKRQFKEALSTTDYSVLPTKIFTITGQAYASCHGHLSLQNYPQLKIKKEISTHVVTPTSTQMSITQKTRPIEYMPITKLTNARKGTI